MGQSSSVLPSSAPYVVRMWKSFGWKRHAIAPYVSVPPPTHAALLLYPPWLGATIRSRPWRSTTTRGLPSSSGPLLLPRIEVRWFLRSSLRSSFGPTHCPRSSSTTLSPATASSLATIPPPAPAPMTTASTFRIAASIPSAHRNGRNAEHPPAGEVAIAAVPGIAVEALHRVGHDELEEGLLGFEERLLVGRIG